MKIVSLLSASCKTVFININTESMHIHHFQSEAAKTLQIVQEIGAKIVHQDGKENFAW